MFAGYLGRAEDIHAELPGARCETNPSVLPAGFRRVEIAGEPALGEGGEIFKVDSAIIIEVHLELCRTDGGVGVLNECEDGLIGAY